MENFIQLIYESIGPVASVRLDNFFYDRFGMSAEEIFEILESEEMFKN